MEIHYPIYFQLFFIFSIISIIINIIFYCYKKKEYSLVKAKKIVYVFLITSSVFLILGLPFFITNSPRVIINSFDRYLIPIILYNFAVFFFSISIIFFCLPYLETDENFINLDIPSYPSSKKGTVKIGRCLKGKKKKHNFFLSIKDLEKHMFICGATGTGKSNFLQNFLIHFTGYHKIPFLLTEFKGEHHVLQKMIEDVLILWPGKNFSINIFNPEKSNPIIHAERIFDILKSGQFLDSTSAEYSPQMEKVLVEILTKVCQNEESQDWEGFERECEKYLKKNQNIIPMLKQTLISIKNRIRRFSSGPLKVLFEKNNQINNEVLFKRNIILDLSSIIRLGGEKEDAIFFLNMIFKYLWDRNLTHGAFNYKGIKHITIVEDAQYFAPQDLTKKSKLTTYLEDIALLQRGTGECLITLATRPDISKEILANNGIILTFKNHMEKDLMCELLNLELEFKNFLSILEEGQCIVRINSIKEPFLLWVPIVKRFSLKFSEIMETNNRILNNEKVQYSSIKDSNYNKKIQLKGQGSRISFGKLNSLLKSTRNNLSRMKIHKKSSNNETNINNISQKSINLQTEFLINEKTDKNFEMENKSKTNNLECIENNPNIFPKHNNRNMDLKIVFEKYAIIKDLYRTKSYNDLISECNRIINVILEKVSQQIGIRYKNIHHFLKNISKLKLERKFILFDEIFKFRKISDVSKKDFESLSPKEVDSIYFLTKRIISKLESIWQKKKEYSSLNQYKSLDSKLLAKTEHFQGSKTLKAFNITHDQLFENDNNQDYYRKLKSFINELYKSQIKNK